tara:strand:- start:130 stop:327 length:198 start_codon:yes stop_codon:yes gene_type:complete
MVAGPRNNKMKSSPKAKVIASTPIKNTDSPSDKPKGKTMGELGLNNEQLKKAYPWGGGSGYSPSK